MSRIEIVTDVPLTDLDELVEDFETDGAEVRTKEQADGKWVAVAVFPDNNNDDNA